MKKPRRNAKSGNPAKKPSRGNAPEDRPGGWFRWLKREHNAFWGLPYLSREFVLLLLLLVVGVVVWAWRSIAA